MSDLNELRGSLDNLDNALVAILSEKFKVTYMVGIYKVKNDLLPVDSDREKE